MGVKGKLQLEVNPTEEPVCLPQRKIPMALHDPVFKELESLQSGGVMAPVEANAVWVSGMVIVKKPSGIYTSS